MLDNKEVLHKLVESIGQINAVIKAKYTKIVEKDHFKIWNDVICNIALVSE